MIDGWELGVVGVVKGVKWRPRRENFSGGIIQGLSFGL